MFMQDVNAAKVLARDTGFRYKMILLAGFFVILNAIDLWITLVVLEPGTGMELNPFIAWVLTLPLPSAVIIKIGLSVLLSTLIVLVSRRFPIHCHRVLVVLSVAMLVVLFINTVGYFCLR